MKLQRVQVDQLTIIEDQTVRNPQFVVDGILVTGLAGNQAQIRGLISDSLINCVKKYFQPRSKNQAFVQYQSALVTLKETHLVSKSQLRAYAELSALAIVQATGFTVPSRMEKFSLNFQLQYHHVSQPDVVEYMPMCTLTSNDKRKLGLVYVIIEHIVLSQHMSSLLSHDISALENLEQKSE